MAIKCQASSCEHEFHDAILDPFEAISEGFEDSVWSYDRPNPDGIGVETLRFCSSECASEFIEEAEVGNSQ